MRYLIFLTFIISILNADKIRVGIIGSGICGLNLAKLLLKNNRFDIDVLEAASSVGGRIQSIHMDDKVLDVGAAVFQEGDKYINDLVDELKLTKDKVSGGGLDSPVGVIGKDGLHFQLSSWDIINGVKMAWRYGLSPFYFKFHIDFFNNKHDFLYKLLDNKNSYKTISDMVHLMDMNDLVNITMSKWVKNLNLKDLYIDEMINGTINSIFNQNDMSAFAGLFALSKIDKEYLRIKGGNGLITNTLVDKLKENQHFNLHLNTPVRIISKTDNKTYQLSTGIMGKNLEYDIVVIASPLSIASLHFGNGLEHLNSFVNSPKPVNLHVTYIEGEMNTEFFKGGHPKYLLTTHLSHINGIFNYGDFFRIHSRNKLTKAEIDEIGIFRKFKMLHDFVWSYSCGKFDPILNFSEVPNFVLDNKLFYASAHEIVGSTIDLSMMSSKNVANMIEDMFIDKISKDDI